MNDLTIKIHRMISVLNKRHHRFSSIDLLSCTEEFHRDPLCLFLIKHFNETLLSSSELVFFHAVKQKLIKAYITIGINDF